MAIGSDNDLFLTVLAPRGGVTLYLINPPPRRWTGTPSDMAMRARVRTRPRPGARDSVRHGPHAHRPFPAIIDQTARRSRR